MLLLFKINDQKVNISSKVESRYDKIKDWVKVERYLKPNGKPRLNDNRSLNDGQKVELINCKAPSKTLISKIKGIKTAVNTHPAKADAIEQDS